MATQFDPTQQLRPPDATKGDLLVNDGTKWTPLTPGTDGQVLASNSGEDTGLEWQSGAGGLGDPGGNGIVVRTSLNTSVNRTIVDAGSSRVSITNGDGVSGNPTLDVSEANLDLDNIGGTLGIDQGGTGQTAKTAAMDALSPTTTEGDLLVDDGTNVVRIPIGTDGQVLTANSAAGNGFGLEWDDATGGLGDPGGNGIVVRTSLNTSTNRTIVDAGSGRITVADGDGVSGNPTLDVDESALVLDNLGGTLSISKGGTGQTAKTAAFDALAPGTTKGDLVLHDGTNNVRRAVGSDGQALVADSAQTSGVAWQTISGSVPSGTQGQKLSFGVANVLSARDWVVLAEDYGAVGDGTTDDTAALLAAFAAVIGTGKTLWLSKTYKITSSLAVAGANFTVDGGGTLAAYFPAASSEDIIRISAAGTGVTTGFNESLAKAAAPYSILTDLDVDDATGLAVGDYVQLLFDDSTDVFSQVSILRDITSNTLTFDDPVLIPTDASHASSVLEQAMRDSIHIRNLIFTGTNSASATVARAIRATSLANSSIENCKFYDFTVSAAINADLGYNCRFDGLYLQNSGGSESDLQLQNFSNSFIDNIMSVNASGFGPQLIRWTNCKVGKINSTGASSRAFKMQGCTWNQFDEITASKSQTGTGFSVSNACYSNTIDKVIAHDNADQGVWFSGERNLYNRINSVQAYGNDADSSGVDISFSSGDENNHVFSADYLLDTQEVNGANSITRRSGIHTYDSSTVTVANTASETLLKFIRFPANSLKAGSIIRITASGRYSTANGSDSVAIGVRLSGTAFVGPLATELGTTTNDHWSVESLIYIVAAGGSGTFDAITKFQYRNAAATLVNAHSTRTHSGQTIDTTASRDFELTATWDNGLSGNSLTCETFIVERLN